MSRRVVITGLGLATPIGIGQDDFWSALLEKRSGIRRITAFDPSRFRSQVAGEVPSFALADYIPKSYRKSVKVMCRDITLAMVAAHQAVADAGLKTRCLIERKDVEGPPNVDPTRFGANIGAGLICADLNELAGALSSALDADGRFSLRQWGQDGMYNLTPLWLLKFLPNMLACHVTIVHDAQAPSNTMTCGEASSHHAIGEAFRTIQRDQADVCICGGAESRLNCMGMMRQDLFDRVASGHNQDPEAACRPFHQDHAGSVISEGGGLVILEALDHAQARGAHIYGELVGFGAAANTYSWKHADPQGRGISLAVTTALADGGLDAGDVSLISTFGSGVPEFDRSEAAALRAVFGVGAETIPALAIKGALGNSGAGSGAIDFAAGLLALKHNTIPVSVNTRPSAAGCGLNFVAGEAVDARIETVLSVAYALSGGQSAALVVRRFR